MKKLASFVALPKKLKKVLTQFKIMLIQLTETCRIIDELKPFSTIVLCVEIEIQSTYIGLCGDQTIEGRISAFPQW